jgi:hypothetical protein
MTTIDFKQLIYSASYYLSYQDKIGKKFMINESSLKYPVAEYLSGLELALDNIQLEYPHPYLKKRNIDLITTDKTKKKVEVAFEFKIAKQITKYEPEQKRIFNDLMRLHLIGQSNDCDCYFLIMGTQIDFIQYFRSIVSTRPVGNSKDLPMPQGFYTEWFKFKDGDTVSFKVETNSNIIYMNIYDGFIEEYKAKNDTDKLKLPPFITTKCIAISALSREFPTPYVGGIWKVE